MYNITNIQFSKQKKHGLSSPAKEDQLLIRIQDHFKNCWWKNLAAKKKSTDFESGWWQFQFQPIKKKTKGSNTIQLFVQNKYMPNRSKPKQRSVCRFRFQLDKKFYVGGQEIHGKGNLFSNNLKSVR